MWSAAASSAPSGSTVDRLLGEVLEQAETSAAQHAVAVIENNAVELIEAAYAQFSGTLKPHE